MNPIPSRDVSLIGIPLGYGAAQTGSELGVEAMRASRVRGKFLGDHIVEMGYKFRDLGNVDVTRPTTVAEATSKTKYLQEMLSTFQVAVPAVKSILDEGSFPVVLGGDHSIAIATFSGVAAHFQERSQEVGLIWFDAHADINTPESSPTGNIHGMPLSILLGEGPDELVNLGGLAPKLKREFFAHVGGRDFDAGERLRIEKLGLQKNFFTMSDIDKRGMMACVQDAIAIASRASGGYAVTLDIDMLDPTFAPGSGTLVRGGATYREAHLALEIIAEHGGMRSFEIVEVNPLLDQSNITVELACELVLSALGKTIL
jgi:arginase